MDPDCSLLTVAQLKDELRKYGLALGGLKAELCDRLRNYYQEQGISGNTVVVTPTTVTSSVPKLNSRYDQKYAQCELDEDGNVYDPVSASIVDPNEIISFIDNGKTFCFSVDTIRRLIQNNDLRNPYTRNLLPQAVIDQARGHVERRNTAESFIRLTSEGALAPVDRIDPRDINRIWNETTPLITALNYAMPVRTIEALLKKGADPNLIVIDDQDHEYIPLFGLLNYTARRGDQLAQLVPLLIDYGADINIKNRQGDTFLDYLLQHGNYAVGGEIICLLLQNGAEVPRGIFARLSPQNAQVLAGQMSREAIDTASLPEYPQQAFEELLGFDTVSHIEAFLQIQTNGGTVFDINSALPESHLTPIQFVLQRRPGDIDLLNLLIRHGAIVTQADINSTNSPLLKQVLRAAVRENLDQQLSDAVRRNDLAAVQTLISQGASIRQTAQGQSNPIAVAARGNHDIILEYLLNNVPLSDSQLTDALLTLAIFNKDKRLAQIILAKGIDPTVALFQNLYDEDGDVQLDYPDIKYLIDLGADPGTDEHILSLALQNGDYDLVKRMLDAGTIVDQSEVESAAGANDIGVINLLLDRGLADINQDDGAIIQSRAFTRDPRFQDLINRGANVGLNVALRSYVSTSNVTPDQVEVLINAGVDPLANDYEILRYAFGNSRISPDVREYFIRRYPIQTGEIMTEFAKQLRDLGGHTNRRYERHGPRLPSPRRVPDISSRPASPMRSIITPPHPDQVVTPASPPGRHP